MCSQLTYVIVGFGAKPDVEFVETAFEVAAIRIAGIVMGSLLSMILAVVLLPRSANVEACRQDPSLVEGSGNETSSQGPSPSWLIIALPGPSLREIKKALELLVDLNREVWKTTSHAFERQPKGKREVEGSDLSKVRHRVGSNGRLERITQMAGSGLEHVASAQSLHEQQVAVKAQLLEELEAGAEKLVMDIYGSLAKVRRRGGWQTLITRAP